MDRSEPSVVQPIGPSVRPKSRASTTREPRESDASRLREALVERARAGDMQAWSRLYQDTFDGLFRHLRYLCSDPQVAEELVQETFVQAMSSIATFDGRAAFTTWLHGIGVNVARRHWRSVKSTKQAHAKLEVVRDIQSGDPDATERELQARQRVAALQAAIAQLPDHLRAAFILRELQGLSIEESAAQLGISANNLAVRASRARARIRKLLASEVRR